MRGEGDCVEDPDDVMALVSELREVQLWMSPAVSCRK